MIPEITIDEILGRYPVILFDAFGVLLNASGALPGACELINRLNKNNHQYLVLTNGSKFPLETMAERYQAKGLSITSNNIISSGSLVQQWLKQQFPNAETRKPKCLVLGPDSAKQVIQDAGGEVLPDFSDSADVVIIGDQSDLKFPDAIDHALTVICRSIDQNPTPIKMLLPNPDLYFPAGVDSYGITSGSIATIIESILEIRYPDRKDLVFEKLGKPFAPIFVAAEKRTGTRQMVMIGDQLTTDIAGANEFGIDSILMGTGNVSFDTNFSTLSHTPNYLMRGFANNASAGPHR